MIGRLAPAVLGGALAGVAGGFFGVGGGIVLIPLLTGRFRLSQHLAHGTSLAVVGATALVSVWVYALHGQVAWLTALIVALASVWTARWGARLAAKTSSIALTRAFAVFLILVALRMLWQAPAGAEHTPLVTGSLGIATNLAIGIAVGLMAGYMGVGGGILAVPAFTFLLGMSQQMAQGTSLAVILATAPAGALEHHRRGNVATELVPAFAIGTVLGGPLASVLAQQVPQVILVRAFAVFILVNAVGIWRRAERMNRAPVAPPG